MLKIKDFKNKGYISKEVLPKITILKKNVQDSLGLCYTIKVVVEGDDLIEPEVTFKSNPESTVYLKVDEITTIDEIEEFFKNIWYTLGKVR